MFFQISEDCLHAQINLPGKLLEKKKAGQSYHYTLKSNTKNAKLPVMVFFYGGAFRFGGSYEYQPKYIAERGNVIVVIPNYRYMSVLTRDVEAEAGSGSGGSGPFSVEAEAEEQKIYRFRFHIGYLT